MKDIPTTHEERAVIARFHEVPGDPPDVYYEGEEDRLKKDFQEINEYRGPIAAMALFEFPNNRLPAGFEDLLG